MPQETAAAVVWFDALVHNVDRSWRNPNLLCWHRRMWLIDHGAALYFAHNWPQRSGATLRPYAQVGDHVLLSSAGAVGGADAELAPKLTRDVLRDATRVVPDQWLVGEPGFASPDEVRAAYVEVLAERLARRDAWVPALEDARARL